jgi:hypothetical protein
MNRHLLQVLVPVFIGVTVSVAMTYGSAVDRSDLGRTFGASEPVPATIDRRSAETPVLDDGTWTQILPLEGRADHTAVYDPLRDCMVVFGGWNGSLRNDVRSLSFNVTPAWTELAPTGTPPNARRQHSAVLDPVRDRMVVFGGVAPSYRNDVWVLSLGEIPAWSQLTPSGTPPGPRRSHTAIYDPVNDRMVMFGGFDGTYRNDVWALSLGGTPTWTALTVAGSPPAGRADHTAIYDPLRGRMVVFGGTDGTFRNDVWVLSLDGTPTWTELTPSGTLPVGRADHSAIYDPVNDRMLVYGEYDGHVAVLGDVWAFSLGGVPEWTEVTPPGNMPSGRWAHSAIFHPTQNRMVIYGGYPNYANDVWALALDGGANWTELTFDGAPPSGRSFHTAIHDPIRDRMIVCCGYPLFETQVWELSLGGRPAWTRLTPSGTPPVGRKNATAIYDPVRDRMIMFGGFLTYPDDPNLHLSLNDLWELSLDQDPTWTELTPAGTPPSKRDAHTAIYDPIRDRIVVFGGYPGYTNDVWALALSPNLAWTKLLPTGGPPIGRGRHTAIYDPIEDRMLVFGGYTSDYTCLNDTWALSLAGSPEWTELFPGGTLPKARGRHSAVYDPLRNRMVIFGAYDCDFDYLNDTWELSLSGGPTWAQLFPAGALPHVRSGQSALYDPTRDQMVVFGGNGWEHLNDVWGLVWGSDGCAVPEIASFGPALLNAGNCASGCSVDFAIETQDDYSAVTRLTLERFLEGSWVLEDSLLAPLLSPPWVLTCDVDEHFSDGEHVFRAVFTCGDGSKGTSETAVVVADRGVAVAVEGFILEYSEGDVILHWSVGEGLAILGFNVYRSNRGQTDLKRINRELVPPHEGNTYADGSVAPGTTYWYRLGAVDDEGEWLSPTLSITVPSLSFELRQNAPNPFGAATSISYFVPLRSRVTLRVYDVGGRHVRTLLDDVVDVGAGNAHWDGRDHRGNRVGSGVYFYELRAAKAVLTRKLVLLK